MKNRSKQVTVDNIGMALAMILAWVSLEYGAVEIPMYVVVAIAFVLNNLSRLLGDLFDDDDKPAAPPTTGGIDESAP